MSDTTPIMDKAAKSVGVAGDGFVKSVGWRRDIEMNGDDTAHFEAIVRFPDGPPNLPANIVWQNVPVNIVPKSALSRTDEPVAWRYLDFGSEWAVTESKEAAETLAAQGHKVVPLYASVSPRSEDAIHNAAVREAALPFIATKSRDEDDTCVPDDTLIHLSVTKAQRRTLRQALAGTADLPLPDIEAVSAEVHAAWMEAKRASGVQTRKSESGEELMVPYADLSEAAKELDRSTVRAVYKAIHTLIHPKKEDTQ